MSGTNLTAKQHAFVLAYLETGNASESYRRAYNVSRMKEGTINNAAYEMLRVPHISLRVNELRERAVNTAVLDRAGVINLITEIATADATAFSELQIRNCRHCWGVGHRFQWANETEFAFRCAEVMDRNAKAVRKWQAGKCKPRDEPVPEELPTDEGGYGFIVTHEPNAECPSCLGEGLEVVRFKDTRKLKGASKRLFAGIKTGPRGIEIKTRSQEHALGLLAKIHGIGDDDLPPPVQGTTINNYGQAVVMIPTDPLEAARAYQELMKGG